jgi:hypothetical protein
MFLFFGWFRKVEEAPGGYRYRRGERDLHVIFGWLRVGQVLRPGRDRVPSWLTDHPHAAPPCPPHNTIYIADEQGGAGIFPTFRPDLQLTAPEGRHRSRWRLPADFHPNGRVPLTYHADEARWRGDGDFCRLQSVAKGQEFVLDVAEYPGVQRWAEELIRDGATCIW